MSDRWAGSKYVVITGPEEPSGAPRVREGQARRDEGNDIARAQAIDQARNLAACLPGREVCVYERVTRFVAEVGPVKEVGE